MSKCPKCKKSPLNGIELICDNDCGTTFCEFCQFEYHINQNRKLTNGHAPWCGESDSEYVDSSGSESNSGSSEDYESESESKSNKSGESVQSYLNKRMDRIESDNESDSNESESESE